MHGSCAVRGTSRRCSLKKQLLRASLWPAFRPPLALEALAHAGVPLAFFSPRERFANAAVDSLAPPAPARCCVGAGRPPSRPPALPGAPVERGRFGLAPAPSQQRRGTLHFEEARMERPARAAAPDPRLLEQVRFMILPPSSIVICCLKKGYMRSTERNEALSKRQTTEAPLSVFVCVLNA